MFFASRTLPLSLVGSRGNRDLYASLGVFENQVVTMETALCIQLRKKCADALCVLLFVVVCCFSVVLIDSIVVL